jgi:hypothetical protein
MKNLMMAVGMVLAIGGCGGGGLEKEMSSWKDKMCACKDKACTEKTMDDYRAWTKTKRDEAKKMAKADLDKLEAIEDGLKECRNKFRDDAAPPTPTEPAVEPATPPPAAPPAATP